MTDEARLPSVGCVASGRACRGEPGLSADCAGCRRCGLTASHRFAECASHVMVSLGFRKL